MRSRSLRRWIVRIALILAVGAAVGSAIGVAAASTSDADDVIWGTSGGASVVADN
jgi:hypothetical protein